MKQKLTNGLKFLFLACKAIAFWPTYLILGFGPMIYYLKYLNNPSNFLMDFSMLAFTIGMFSLLIRDLKENHNLAGIGFLYLLSGSLSILLLFTTPFIKNNSTDNVILSGTLGDISTTVGTGLVSLVFIGSLIGYSLSFGLATTGILKATYETGKEPVKQIWNQNIDSLGIGKLESLKFEIKD